MEIVFRTATTEDIEALRAFEQCIIDTERAFDPTLKAEPFQYHDIDKMLLGDHAKIIVAQKGEQLVACGFARIDDAEPHLSHSQQAYLGLMFVDPGYRGRSINTEIVERLKQWCREKGVMELRLELYSDNLAAVKAYEKSGFSKHIVEMRLRLEDER